MLLGTARTDRDAPKLLLVKARIEHHQGETSAPAQGPMYLGAVARADGWDVRCVDTYLQPDDEAAVQEALRAFPASVVGISALTAEARSMHRLARAARRAAPGATILAGGAHPSAEPESVAADPNLDAAVVGEGERTLLEVLRRLREGQEWRDVPGLFYRDEGGTVRQTATRPFIEDLDELPMPAWDLTDLDAYSRRRGMSLVGLRRYMPLTTSRGCPYRCTYCHDIQGKRFRSHSPEYVLSMIDQLRTEHDVHNFDMTDDIFNFDADRLMSICDGLIARGAGIRFSCPNGVRADRMTVEQVDKMARAGCDYVAVAIETVTGRLQKQIRKHLRFDKLRPVLDAFTERNVLTCGFFMLGFPSETEEELRATVDFATSSKLHVAHFFVVTPYGGTEMHEQITDSMGSASTQLGGTGMFLRPRHNLSRVPDDRFFRLRRRAYLRFYANPVRIGRIWRAHPQRGSLLRYCGVMLLRDTLRLIPERVMGRFAHVLLRG
jgi:radical SAM superfamily enzyme YgiQ (UPF0313 family)